MRGMGIVVLSALACAGEQAASRAPAANERTPPGGVVVEVEMAGDGARTAKFEPAAITIAPGGTVRFVNVSVGVPHAVVFWGDSIPAGAAERLGGAMPNRVDRLSGPYVVHSNDVYAITFPTDAPPGEYRAYCLSHLALGMQLRITVR